MSSQLFFVASSTDTQAALPETFLLIAIMSSPNESEVRTVIRNTWLRLSQKGPTVVQHRFSIGTKGLSEAMRLQLEEEQKAHGDLAVIENLEETYSNLALKTLRT
ncbi:hypothetical protein COOONC_11422, partial [Cooperia oncophora]